MEDFDSLLPYLPFFIVVAWGVYRMLLRLIQRCLPRGDEEQ